MRQRVKQREGTVVSAKKMTKTVVVQVDRLVQHPIYGKRMKDRSRLLCHDEKGECGEGDKVTIIESRPISKSKRWRVSRIVAKAAG